jgi:choline-glycine betaine transporter
VAKKLKKSAADCWMVKGPASEAKVRELSEKLPTFWIRMFWVVPVNMTAVELLETGTVLPCQLAAVLQRLLAPRPVQVEVD